MHTLGGRHIFYARRPLILASTSPRRSALLAELGLCATIVSPPQAAEPLPLADEDSATYSMRAALAKAYSVFNTAGPAADLCGHSALPVVIAADTVVELRGRILGKPDDADHALEMLRALAGKTHAVTTACALLGDEKPRVFAVRSRVRMWDCPDELLRAYAKHGEGADKAGAYAVQGAGAFLVRGISGSWSNVVGLPLSELVEALMAMRAIEAAR